MNKHAHHPHTPPRVDQRNDPPNSNSKRVSWSYRIMDDGSLAKEWMTQRQLYYWKLPPECVTNQETNAHSNFCRDLLASWLS